MTDDVMIAERVLKRRGDGREVRVQIFAPKQVEDGDWECRVHVDGLAVADKTGYGIDGFQALVEGLKAARAVIATEVNSLTWVSNFPGDTGIPLVLPYEDPRLEALIEDLVGLERHRFFLYASPLPSDDDAES